MPKHSLPVSIHHQSGRLLIGHAALFSLIIVGRLWGMLGSVNAAESAQGESVKPLLMAHYMPWYAADSEQERWGWHWTMDHFDPQKNVDRRREVASHYYPLIGPYDSGDPNVIEYHLLLMKLAGIDGVIVDWYGLADYRDYRALHENTKQLVDQIERMNMKLVICYEDQTIPALEQAGRIKPNERVALAVDEINWLDKNWFPLDCYARFEDRPMLLSFGHAGLTNEEWTKSLDKLANPVAYFSEHYRRDGAVGGFDWPIPKQGLDAVKRFNQISSQWPQAIPVAFPRFVDIYRQAKVSEGYGRIDDDEGRTFRKSFEQALGCNPKMIQIATWNDWGEGTQIEPSEEFGYRDLEHIQQVRRTQIDEQFAAVPSDLRLAIRVWRARKNPKIDRREVDRVVNAIADGKFSLAGRVMEDQLTDSGVNGSHVR